MAGQKSIYKLNCNGKYIAFLDDDDYWLETKLQKQIDILENTHYLMSCSDAFASFGNYEKKEKNRSVGDR